MNIITSNPIIKEADFREEDWYNFGEATQRRRQTRQSNRQRNKARRQATKEKSGGTFLQKTGRAAQGISQSGILDTLAGLGQQGRSDVTDTDLFPRTEDPIPLPPTSTKKEMSTATKVFIGIAVVSALGVGVYFLMKMKSKKGKK
jgi:hypothetical protein